MKKINKSEQSLIFKGEKKMTKEEMKNEIEQEHNVYVDDDCQYYNHTSHDSETGWMPIPEEWLK